MWESTGEQKLSRYVKANKTIAKKAQLWRRLTRVTCKSTFLTQAVQSLGTCVLQKSPSPQWFQQGQGFQRQPVICRQLADVRCTKPHNVLLLHESTDAVPNYARRRPETRGPAESNKQNETGTEARQARPTSEASLQVLLRATHTHIKPHRPNTKSRPPIEAK